MNITKKMYIKKKPLEIIEGAERIAKEYDDWNRKVRWKLHSRGIAILIVKSLI